MLNETLLNESVLGKASNYNLTDSEKQLLSSKAGTDNVKTTKAVVENKRLVVKYELGQYWVEYSYNYNGQITSELKDLMDLERNYWLKNLVKQLQKENPDVENVNSLLQDYSLNSTITSSQTDDENLTNETNNVNLTTESTTINENSSLENPINVSS